MYTIYILYIYIWIHVHTHTHSLSLITIFNMCEICVYIYKYKMIQTTSLYRVFLHSNVFCQDEAHAFGNFETVPAIGVSFGIKMGISKNGCKRSKDHCFKLTLFFHHLKWFQSFLIQKEWTICKKMLWGNTLKNPQRANLYSYRLDFCELPAISAWKSSDLPNVYPRSESKQKNQKMCQLVLKKNAHLHFQSSRICRENVVL